MYYCSNFTANFFSKLMVPDLTIDLNSLGEGFFISHLTYSFLNASQLADLLTDYLIFFSDFYRFFDSICKMLANPVILFLAG